MGKKRSTANALHIAKGVGRKGYATTGLVEDENAYLNELQQRATELNQPVPQQQPQGISRVGSGFFEGFGPGDVGISAENRAKYPVLSGTLAGPAYVLDATGRLIMGGAGALSGAVGAGTEALTNDPGYGNYMQRQTRGMFDYFLNRGDVVPSVPPKTGVPKQGEVLPPVREALPEPVPNQPFVIDQARGVLEAPRPALPEPIRQIDEPQAPQVQAPVQQLMQPEAARVPEQTRPVAEQTRPVEPVVEQRPIVEQELTPDQLAAELHDLDPRSLEEIYGLKRPGGNWIERRTLPNEVPVKLDPDLADLETQFDPSKWSAEYLNAMTLHPNSLASAIENFKRTQAFDYGNLENTQLPDYLSRWIDTKLEKYVRNELGTVNDPVFKLAEQGILHVNPQNLAGIFYNRFGDLAETEVRGNTRSGKAWDMATKGNITSTRAKIYNEQHGTANPWLAKLDPNTEVYGLRSNALNNLGFDHLIDELRAATDPASDLPRELRINPAKLDRITVPQAIDKVDKINKWREEQMRQAEIQKATNPATVPVKEYPDGMRWVELQVPTKDVPLPANYTVEPYKDASGKEHFVLKGKNRYDEVVKLGEYDTPEEAARQANLSDALKYEGKVMGHCVGNDPKYCLGIKAGNKKIFSLRDANGEPHATIEAVKPIAKLSDEDRAWISQQTDAVIKQEDYPDTEMTSGFGRYNSAWHNYADKLQNELLASKKSNLPMAVEQIKGKANLAVKPKYESYVQDFIMNNEWSDIKELSNAGLYSRDQLEHTPPYSMKDVSKDARRRALAAATEAGEIPQYVTMQQWEDILRKYLAPDEYTPRKHGGRISDHFHHDDIIPRGFYANGGFPELVDLETQVPERKWYEPVNLETKVPERTQPVAEPQPTQQPRNPFQETLTPQLVDWDEPVQQQPAAQRPVSPMAYAPPQPSAVGNVAMQAINRSSPRPEPQVFPYQPSQIAGADVVWNRMIKQESGGKQFNRYGQPLRSSKGATGIAQVLPQTGPEAAALANLPWDPQRFQYDADYNLKLGRAYYERQLARYGDPILAAAAYNTGPGNLDRALRRARETGRDWRTLVHPETQNYVQVMSQVMRQQRSAPTPPPAAPVQVAQSTQTEFGAYPTQPKTGVFAFGTNDSDPKTTLEAAQSILEQSKRIGIDPVFILPNPNDRRFAPMAYALKDFADKNGIKYEVPTYDERDPLHMTPRSAQDIAKKYPNALVAGDSNSWRIQRFGYNRPVTSPREFADPYSKQTLGRVGAGSPEIAKWIAGYADYLARQGKKDGGTVVKEALMIVSQKAKRRRGRPD